jgi:predicted transcriptional regulator
MKMNEYLKKGQEKAGSQIKLAKILEVSDRYIRQVRDGDRSLADDVCIRLADYIGEDRLEVIAASNLVTEKDERKRKIFESCFKKTSQAACIGLVVGITMIMTPIPAKADITTAQKQNNLYYVQS